ncbi:radical SAM family heme chaperone HemW [Arboricoccus pini]|uniref:radical SAM family heme chaperone HemW n=1 Tax=Arboricoccus pini TaxID=1963835 RepID=UPI002AC830F2|nr:radical SAM family heme chaperone HemW [Arboricoccus pini]
MGAIWPDPGFALYVHWPFCKAKCPYCDFNSHVRGSVDQETWRRGLLVELDHMASMTGSRPLRSIFFGGGTPSLMSPATVEAVIARASRRFCFERDIEITLEANPTSVEAGRFERYRQAGVNRLSLGVQALDGEALRFLGREHSAGEALAALDLARRIFPRFSFDLIYGRPGQSLDAWERELRQALALAGDHLSLYQLTIEQGTRFASLAARGELVMPDDELQADFYTLTQSLMEEAGMPAYEISNHARPGGESRHNLVYWRYGDYAGIGPGAHGRLTLADGRRVATRTERLPERWLRNVERDGHALVETTIVTDGEQVVECLMMGLRLSEGVSLTRLERLRGLEGPRLDPAALRMLVDGGFVRLTGDRLVATASGRAMLDAVLRRLLQN